MVQKKRLEEYCKSSLLDVEIDNDILLLNNKEYQIVDDQELLFDEDLDFLPISKYEVDGFVYLFGGRWYLQLKDEKVSLEELRYQGAGKQKIPTDAFLGIRSGYELMNGMGLYKDYVKKGSFLGVKTLGICEKNTLSGCIAFQSACREKNIKPITGMTIPVKGLSVFDIKLYVKNFQGWLDLLKINTLLNVQKAPFILLKDLEKYIQDLFVVADPKTMDFSEDKTLIDFYQLDTVNFLNPDADSEYIDNLEKFILSDLEPISITDSFYLEQRDYITREVMWAIGKSFDMKTDNQYFKNKDEYATELIKMFKETDKSWISLFKKAVANEEKLAEECNFIYDTDTRHLPAYIMTDEEAAEFKTNDELFIHLIKKGFEKKNIKDPAKYIERLRVEIEVLKFADVLDYFLSLYDIIRFSDSKKMLTGLARGSAAGSLVAYLLGIIKIDPLEFDLLFERFLNSGRAGTYEDRPLYILKMDNGKNIELAEGTLVRIKRGGRETADYVSQLKEGDEIIRY